MSPPPADAWPVDAAPSAQATDYLRIDAYLGSFIHARALKTAFELGLVDRLLQSPPAPRADWARQLEADGDGFSFLCDLLVNSGVLAPGGDAVALHDDFRASLRYRDLLEAKLDFCGMVLGLGVGTIVYLILDKFRKKY